MKSEDVWKEMIAAELAGVDMRLLKIIYYFIIGLKKREGRIK